MTRPEAATDTVRVAPVWVLVSVKPPAAGGAVGEIPETDERLLENDYEFITRRLTGFYRWGGANRNFARSMKRSGSSRLWSL